MEFSTVQTQLKSTERVLRKRPVTREHHCVAVESRADAGARIRERRNDLDLTQQGLADRSGVGLSSVKRLEAGQRIERRVERKVAGGLGWTDESIDLVFAGRDPLSRVPAAAAEHAWASSIRDEVLTMSHEEMAQRAAWVVEVTGDPAEGDKLMEGMLRIRRQGREGSTDSGELGN